MHEFKKKSIEQSINQSINPNPCPTQPFSLTATIKYQRKLPSVSTKGFNLKCLPRSEAPRATHPVSFTIFNQSINQSIADQPTNPPTHCAGSERFNKPEVRSSEGSASQEIDLAIIGQKATLCPFYRSASFGPLLQNDDIFP